MNFEFQPIGKDVTNIYGFVFGRYRYQVEWFDHKKEKENVPGMFVVFDYWDNSVNIKKILSYILFEVHRTCYCLFSHSLKFG